MAAIAAIEAVAKAEPALAAALRDLFAAHAQGKDPSHALRQVEGQAALALLGIS